MTKKFSHRIARMTDMTILTNLMNTAILTLQSSFLNTDQVAASFEIMGLDTRLIEDKTYFVILCQDCIVGCGGWSNRATLFGGNHTAGRDDALLDPQQHAARIRAMYTHPDWTRQGIGRIILDLCEKAAVNQGFSRFELAATLSGQPLYRAAGYEVIDHFSVKTSKNIVVPLVKMSKII